MYDVFVIVQESNVKVEVFRVICGWVIQAACPLYTLEKREVRASFRLIKIVKRIL